MSINGVSRVAVTSTVLCVLIWLLDIIILALSYSEFCKQSSNYEIDVKKKGSAFRTENKISMNDITRSCFGESEGPFGHGMICSCFAVIASLFAISAHSESGQVRVRSTARFRKSCYKNEDFEKPRKGACVNSKWAYGTSCILSLICTGSAGFGAYLSIIYSNRAENSKTTGIPSSVQQYLGIESLTNEISILRSCLFIECACQGFLALMSLYNVYLCGRLVIFHSRYFIRVSQEEHAQNNSVEIDASGEPRCPSDHLTHATYSLPATTNLDATNNYADSVFLEQGPEPSLVPLSSCVGYSKFGPEMSRTNSFGSGKSGTASESDSMQIVQQPAVRQPPVQNTVKGDNPLPRPGNSSLRAAGRRHRPEKSVSFRGTALVAE